MLVRLVGVLCFLLPLAHAAAQQPPAEPKLTPVIMRGLWSWLTSGAQSPDGKMLITYGVDQRPTLWNTAGDRMRVFESPSSEIDHLEFSADSKTLLLSSSNHIALWNLETNTPYPSLKNARFMHSASLSANGKLVATGTGHDNNAAVWEVATGEQLQTFVGHTDKINCTAFSPDGKTLYTGAGDKQVIAWEVVSGKKIHTFQGHSDYIRSLSLSKDGKLLLTTQGQRAILWNPLTGEKLQTFGDGNPPVCSAIISPDGRSLIFGTSVEPDRRIPSQLNRVTRDHFVTVWNLAKGEKIRDLRGHAESIELLYLSPDSKMLLTSSHDKTILWDFAKGVPVRIYPRFEHQPITSMSLSRDGSVLAVRYDKVGVALWNMKSGDRMKNIELDRFGGDHIQLSSDGKFLFNNASSAIDVWNTTTAAKVTTFKIPARDAHVSPMDVSADNKQLVTGLSDGNAIQWNLATGEIIRLLQSHTQGIGSVSFSGDGKTLATGSYDNTAIVWDATNGKKLVTLTAHNGPVRCTRLTHDGKMLATGSSDNKVILWDTAQGAKLREFDCEYEVKGVVFSPDEKMLYTTTTFDTVTKWEIATGKVHSTLPRNGPGKALALTKDGKLTISAAGEAIKLRDADTGKERLTIEPQLFEWAALTPEGQVDGSPAALKSLVWLRVGESTSYESIERQRAKFLVPRLLGKILRGEPIAVNADPAKGNN